MKASRSNRFISICRKADRFGHPVTLTYKNNAHYKSTLGSALTLVTFVGIFIYFAVLLQATITYQTY